jgi:hypothetical protein
MAFQLSPGVNVTEIDLTTVVPAVATSDGAIGGVFRWGPVAERVLIDSETQLIARFAKPTGFNAETFFTAANFLSYANRLYVSRAANTSGATPVVTAYLNRYVSAISSNNNSTSSYNNTDIIRVVSNTAGGNGTATLTTNSTGGITSVTISSAGYGFLTANPTITVVNSTGGASGGGGANLSVTVTASTNAFVVYTSTNNATGQWIANTQSLDSNMYITQSTSGAQPYGTTVSVTNSVMIALSAATTNTANVTLYMGNEETSYSALAIGSGAYVANLVNQVVKNNNEYTTMDGNFDTDVLYVAKYPGMIGNSLRIAVCDTAASFQSNVTVAAAPFVIGNNSVAAVFSGVANTNYLNIATGDQILAGNSSIGLQYMKVTSVTATNSYTSSSISALSISGGGTGYTNNDVARVVSTTGTNAQYTVSTNTTGGISSLTLVAAGSGFVSVNPTVAIVNSTGGTTTGSTANLTPTVAGNTSVTINFEDPYRLHTQYTETNLQRYWEFFNVVDVAPGQSDYVLANGNTAANDELHVVVVDDGGQFTGTPGTVLEVYKGLSRATDAKNNDTTVNYYKEVINQNSNYIWWANDRGSAASANAALVASSTNEAALNVNMQFGSDGYDETTVSLSTVGSAYDYFVSPEDVDISLVLQGRPIGGTTSVGGITVQNFQLANYIIDNICEVRKDCVALISPDKNTTLNNYGDESLTLKAWRGALRSTSYAVLDSGYKYQYDRYNDLYRWIPLNGDVAGLCVRTDATNDAWWSPAGFNRGQIKNIVKLAWNPRKADRDILYSNGINPVVTFPGQGTILYGDKTLLAKPSAFDRINVRRLFIVLEKAIAQAAKYSLFEFNDAFTRSQFKNLVTPYLRQIQGRRGITDFLVVCDDSNNTAQVIDSNQFVGDIYIKPARSINFIQLNFVAVGTGVQFSEVVGKF